MARAVSSATITFGLVSIPVKLYVSASSESVSFNQITPAGNRVKQKLVDSVTGDEVERDTLLKGYEHSKGEYVVFKPEEIKALEAEKSPVMSITEFVPLTSVDLLGVEKSYYLGPDKGGDSPYALLSSTLDKTSTVAVARWANRGKEQLVVIRSYKGGLVLHQMFYSNEVRPFEDVMEKVAKIVPDPAEVELSEMLVKKLRKDGFDPSKYQDEYSVRVLEAVAQKVKGEAVTTIKTAAGPAKTSNLAAALKASLEAMESQP